MIGQILGNSTGIIKVTAANEGIGYNFGLHNGQHSNAARIAPGSKYRVLSDACAPILYSILGVSGGQTVRISIILRSSHIYLIAHILLVIHASILLTCAR